MPPIPKLDGAARRSVREELERAPHLAEHVDLVALRVLLRRRYRKAGQTTDGLLNISRELRAIDAALPPVPTPEQDESVELAIVRSPPPLCTAHTEEVAACSACVEAASLPGGVRDVFDEHGTAMPPAEFADVLPGGDPDREPSTEAEPERKPGPAPNTDGPAWDLPRDDDGNPIPEKMEPGVRRVEPDEVRLGDSRRPQPWTRNALNRPDERDDGHPDATDGPPHDGDADGRGLAGRPPPAGAWWLGDHRRNARSRARRM